MNITFHGATGEVTGSCHELSISGRSFLLDCGMIQGNPRDEARNRQPFAFRPSQLTAVILSHAHIDHSGRIPLLTKAGFAGPIFAHHATVDLCRIMLRDAAYLDEKETVWQNKKRQRKGLPELSPLYSVSDLDAVFAQFVGLDYDTPTEIGLGVVLTLRDAGHILGSSLVELDLHEGPVRRKLVFTGDLGPRGLPILRDPTPVPEADIVIMESTYGDRCHRPWASTLAELGDIFSQSRAGRGNILIPAFSVGRTQEILYLMAANYRQWNIDKWQIFLDSPLAIEATKVYDRHHLLFDAQAQRLMCGGRLQENLPNLRLTSRPDESMAINTIRSGAIVIAGSGMCTGGRIRQHLKHHVWREGTHVLIVGFQAAGTLGRALVDGARYIRLWGETIRVAARVSTVGGLSAHADQDGLVEWYGHCRKRPPVMLVHGEPRAQEALRDRLQREFAVAARIPKHAQQINLDHL